MQKHPRILVARTLSSGEEPACKRRVARALAAFVLTISLAGMSTPVLAADQYDSDEAGHPLRIAAYVVHPIGVALDYLIMRPAYWIGSHEPFRTLFGRKD